MTKLTTDILIIGAGPAGIAAARMASKAKANILLIDDNPRIGGQIWRDGPNSQRSDLIQKYLNISNHKHFNIMTSTRLVAQISENLYLLEGDEQALQVQVTSVIICTGARELFIPFPGWTLPGVTGAGGLQALIKSGLAIRNQRIVISGSGPLLLASAYTAKQHHGQILAIYEQQKFHKLAAFGMQLYRWPNKLKQSIKFINHHYRPNSFVMAAHGKKKLESITVNEQGIIKTFACDRLACGFGLVPNIQLAQLLGLNIYNNSIEVDIHQQTSKSNIYAAGECTGIGGSELSLAEGAIAGLAATGQYQDIHLYLKKKSRWNQFSNALNKSFELRDELKKLPRNDTIICRCEDVTYESLKIFDNPKQAKMVTRCGMGACQGKICHTSLTYLKSWPVHEIRPPISPARVSTLCVPDETCPN